MEIEYEVVFTGTVPKNGFRILYSYTQEDVKKIEQLGYKIVYGGSWIGIY